MSENFQFLEVKFSIYLNRRVFVMRLGRKDRGAYRPKIAQICSDRKSKMHDKFFS